MKTAPLAALLLFAAAPAFAQDETPATETAETADAKESTAEMMTIENTIEELMSNEATAAILLKHIPGINEHPAYDQFKTMNLPTLQPWSAGAVTDEIIAAVKADLEALAV